MKTIGDHARSVTATNSTKSREQASNVNGLSEHWTAAIFKTLQARYGHKWVSAMDGIEQTAIREWSKRLAGMTAEEIKRGLSDWAGEWPPSLPEFAAACRGKKLGLNEFGLDYTPEVYRRQPERQRERLLSSADRDARRAVASESVKDLRAALKGQA